MKDAKVLPEFGARLRGLRNKRGLTLERLGMQLRPEVSPATAENYIVKLELGYRQPRLSDVRRLSDIFDVEISYLADPVPKFEPEIPPKKRAQDNKPHRRRSAQEIAAQLQINASQPRRIEVTPRLRRSVVHAGHLREMQPERLSEVIDEILKGKLGYSRIQKESK
jgi:transcriptional regulator with XRE-family HTH domain